MVSLKRKICPSLTDINLRKYNIRYLFALSKEQSRDFQGIAVAIYLSIKIFLNNNTPKQMKI